METFQIEKDSIAFLGLMSIANKQFDPQFKHADGELTHTKGLNIFATIIDNTDGDVIGQKRNLIHSYTNPLLHAEQLTLKQAVERLNIKRPRNSETTSVENYYRKYLFNEPNTVGNFNIGATIYTTLEPCPFCTSALLVSRMKRIVYIIPDSKYGDAFTSLKDKYYKSYDITYGAANIQNTADSKIISFAFEKYQILLKYVAENPQLNGTLILDNLKDFLQECSKGFLKFRISDLITQGTDKSRNAKTLKRLQGISK